MGTPQPLVPLRWLTEAVSERDRLEALNAELLAAVKKVLEGTEWLMGEDFTAMQELVAKAEGRE